MWGRCDVVLGANDNIDVLSSLILSTKNCFLDGTRERSFIVSLPRRLPTKMSGSTHCQQSRHRGVFFLDSCQDLNSFKMSGSITLKLCLLMAAKSKKSKIPSITKIYE